MPKHRFRVYSAAIKSHRTLVILEYGYSNLKTRVLDQISFHKNAKL